MKGTIAFGGKIAVLSGFVGGSVLAYVIFVAQLSFPWVLVTALAFVLVVFAVGAYQLWDEADRAARRFMPTWEQIQACADQLRALTEEYRYDGSGRLLAPHEVSDARQVQFRRQYMAIEMMQARLQFDRACAAGYPPEFDRGRIATAQIVDVVELVERLDDAAERWREADRQALPTNSLYGSDSP